MTDYEASWREWAAKQYADAAIAAAAADGAIAASRKGVAADAAAVAGHRAAVRAGGEYTCRPDRTGLAMAIVVILFAMLVPATLAGRSSNPAAAGFVFLAAAVLLPAGAFVVLVMARRNSCLFVNRWSVGRRDWRGRVVMTIAREGVSGAGVDRGSWTVAMIGDEGQPGGHPDESQLAITMQSGQVLKTNLTLWTNTRAAEFAAVAKP